MTPVQALLLFFAAVLGGGLNAVAGGGSFVSFPALLFVGVPPVIANATNSVAIWPAGIAGAVAYRKDIDQPRSMLVTLGISSFVGGAVGAYLLLRTPDITFLWLLPWLMLFACLLFSFGPAISKRLRSGRAVKDGGARSYVLGAILQLAIALYGGYFGGGMGIMMLAVWSVLGMTNVHAMNGLKGLLGVIINGTAIVAFIVAGKIVWGPGLVMVVGATLGGYGAARLARRIDPKWVRGFVVVVGWAITIYFFVKTYA
jgi:uncharacterized protein